MLLEQLKLIFPARTISSFLVAGRLFFFPYSSEYIYTYVCATPAVSISLALRAIAIIYLVH
jgi:hypothetical protein